MKNKYLTIIIILAFVGLNYFIFDIGKNLDAFLFDLLCFFSNTVLFTIVYYYNKWIDEIEKELKNTKEKINNEQIL